MVTACVYVLYREGFSVFETVALSLNLVPLSSRSKRGRPHFRRLCRRRLHGVQARLWQRSRRFLNRRKRTSTTAVSPTARYGSATATYGGEPQSLTEGCMQSTAVSWLLYRKC